MHLPRRRSISWFSPFPRRLHPPLLRKEYDEYAVDLTPATDALFTFFETRHMLLQEDFLAITAKSQDRRHLQYQSIR
jgi:hypothetical protein